MVESSRSFVDQSGSTRVRRSKKLLNSEAEDALMSAAIVLSSTDDEEANRDLSLDILEKAKRREETKPLRKKTKKVPDVVDLTSSEEVEGLEKMKKRRRKKKNNSGKEEENKTILVVEDEDPKIVLENGAANQEEDHFVAADSVVKEVNEAPDNVVFKKLLRGPRYFDSEGCNWQFCYNCSEEGHTAATCRSEKRQKPCFFCGVIGHESKGCPKRSSKGPECYICKVRGHFAKDCPDKENKSIQYSKICLRCGDCGHDMSCCTNSYPSEDVKEIQCYVCKSFGHLCCVDALYPNERVISCYNCGLTGHFGVGCAKVHSQLSTADLSPTLCYKCGEEGHFARGCTKNAKSTKKMGEQSTPVSKVKRKREYSGSKSAPHDFGKSHKKKEVYHEERAWTATKSGSKGGWIVDDPGDFPREVYSVGSLRSPSISRKKVRNDSYSSPNSTPYIGWDYSVNNHDYGQPSAHYQHGANGHYHQHGANGHYQHGANGHYHQHGANGHYHQHGANGHYQQGRNGGHYQHGPSANYRSAYSDSRFGNSGGYRRKYYDQF